MKRSSEWFVIINPSSGNGLAKTQWPKIDTLLSTHLRAFEYAFTEFHKHSHELVIMAVKRGYTKFICIGGDGTLHNIINGIMLQTEVPSSAIKVGVIPLGTGNDWVKTYGISKTISKAISTIKKGSITQQDIGKVYVENTRKTHYFINLLGVGFDGYVATKVHKYKKLGALSYLIGTILGLSGFKNISTKVQLDTEVCSTDALMVLIGLCKFSGGGMQLTYTPDPKDGLFDISIAKHFKITDLFFNLPKLYNGKITSIKKVTTHKSRAVNIQFTKGDLPFIQADGELIGQGDISVELLPKALNFFID